MAVDGVAPRAKMNQQRGRRFRSAKDAEDREHAAISKGEKLPETKRFDSNAITPGTEFMDRLQDHLQRFVATKVSTDPIWRGVDVILSGHETPGEGEHKVQDYIRYLKSLPEYDPDTRHCLYGLDADLIMLGLGSHECHFALLREQVTFFKGRKAAKRANIPEETTFYLLHLSLLRGYIDHEFQDLKSTLPFGYDLERVIDDWILMGFLVGNDFVPHLPNLHIHSDALPLLWATYKTVMPQLDGYLNIHGQLHMRRFLVYVEELSKFDKEWFMDQHADEKWMMGKRGKKLGRQLANLGSNAAPKEAKPASGAVAATKSGQAEPAILPAQAISDLPEMELTALFGDEADAERPVGAASQTNCNRGKGRKKQSRKVKEDTTFRELVEFDFDGVDLTEDPGDLLPGSGPSRVAGPRKEESDEEEDSDAEEEEGLESMNSIEYRMHKRDYYRGKLGVDMNEATLRAQAYDYLRAIQWILFYYYRGVPSWSWFYRQHYAPFMSDLRHYPLADNSEIDFALDRPFFPFEQLMAVLPAASRDLLPSAYQGLMTEPDSPIIDFYPAQFATDLNGKKQEWEAVVLIPFIEESRLVSAIDPLAPRLTPDETRRNRHGPHLLYRYSAQTQAPLPGLPDNHAVVQALEKDHYRVPPDRLRWDVEGSKGNGEVFCPGFPTLSHIGHTAALEKIGVKVFEIPSRNLSMVLRLVETPEDATPNMEEVARQILGRPLYVRWPHFVEVLPVQLITPEVKYELANPDSILIHEDEDPSRPPPLIQQSPLTDNESRRLQASSLKLTDQLLHRRAINPGNTLALIGSRSLVGRRYVVLPGGRLSLAKQWSSAVGEGDWDKGLQLDFHQLSAPGLQVAQSLARSAPCTTVMELYQPGTVVFLLIPPYYGAMGEVLPGGKATKVKVMINLVEEPDLNGFQARLPEMEEAYYPASELANYIQLSPGVVSRLTGTLFCFHGARPPGEPPRGAEKHNIGLGLKFNKRNEQVPGWTRRHTEFGQTTWLYTDRVAEVIDQYRRQFPEVIQALMRSTAAEDFYEVEIFPKDTRDRMHQLSVFLKNLPCRTAELAPISHTVLDEKVLAELTVFIGKHASRAASQARTHSMHVDAEQLYKMLPVQGGLIPDPATTGCILLDRVVNVRPGYAVPLGLRGTVIGVLPSTGADKQAQSNDTVYEVMFDRDFPGALSIRGSVLRCYRLPLNSLINLTDHERRTRGRCAGATNSSSRHVASRDQVLPRDSNLTANTNSSGALVNNQQVQQQHPQVNAGASGNNRLKPVPFVTASGAPYCPTSTGQSNADQNQGQKERGGSQQHQGTPAQAKLSSVPPPSCDVGASGGPTGSGATPLPSDLRQGAAAGGNKGKSRNETTPVGSSGPTGSGATLLPSNLRPGAAAGGNKGKGRNETAIPAPTDDFSRATEALQQLKLQLNLPASATAAAATPKQQETSQQQAKGTPAPAAAGASGGQNFEVLLAALRSAGVENPTIGPPLPTLDSVPPVAGAAGCRHEKAVTPPRPVAAARLPHPRPGLLPPPMATMRGPGPQFPAPPFHHRNIDDDATFYEALRNLCVMGNLPEMPEVGWRMVDNTGIMVAALHFPQTGRFLTGSPKDTPQQARWDALRVLFELLNPYQFPGAHPHPMNYPMVSQYPHPSHAPYPPQQHPYPQRSEAMSRAPAHKQHQSAYPSPMRHIFVPPEFANDPFRGPYFNPGAFDFMTTNQARYHFQPHQQQQPQRRRTPAGVQQQPVGGPQADQGQREVQCEQAEGLSPAVHNLLIPPQVARQQAKQTHEPVPDNSAATGPTPTTDTADSVVPQLSANNVQASIDNPALLPPAPPLPAAPEHPGANCVLAAADSLTTLPQPPAQQTQRPKPQSKKSKRIVANFGAGRNSMQD